MPQCPKCGASHSSEYSTYCSNCQRKADEEQKQHDKEIRSEIKKVRAADPGRADALEREYEAVKSGRGRGGSLWLPIIIGIFVVSAVVSAITFFGKGVYMNFAGETGAMSVIRDEKTKTFVDKGEEIPDDELGAKKTALEAFIQSGSSYRMEGELGYGYYQSGYKHTLKTEVQMSYNHETGIYKFVLTSILGDEKLDAAHRIDDGTYYVVEENGRTWVLSEKDGKKTATDVSADSREYNFLMAYRMESILFTSVIDKTNECLRLWDAEFYRRTYDDKNAVYMIYPYPKTELRVYNDKPVAYLHRYQNPDTEIECQFVLGYYYDNIPQDTPTVSEYQ